MEDKGDSLPPQDTGDPKKIIIEAPTHLAFGQNLFDQPPFTDTVAQVQTQAGIFDSRFVGVVRRAIDYRLTHTEDQRGVVLPIDKFFHAEKLQKGGRGSSLVTAFKGPLDELLDYPFIAEYIQQISQDRTYSTSGVPHRLLTEKSYQDFPTPSYANWFTREIERRGRLISAEVRSLIFGQENVLRASGYKPGWRRWAIVKAAELVK